MRSYLLFPAILALVVAALIAGIIMIPPQQQGSDGTNQINQINKEEIPSVQSVPTQSPGTINSVTDPNGVSNKITQDQTQRETTNATPDPENGMIPDKGLDESNDNEIASSTGEISDVNTSTGEGVNESSQSIQGEPNTVQGTITNTEGTPLYNVKVEAPGITSMVTGSNGYFKLEGIQLPTITLTAEREDYHTIRKEDVPVGSIPLKLTMVRKGHLVGKVLDQFDQPVSSAKVTLQGNQGLWSIELISDPEGRFDVDDPPDSPVRIQASLSGFTDQGQGTKTVNPPFDEEVILRLKQPTYTISGRVVLRENGSGVSGFTLKAKRQDVSEEQEPKITQTDGSGYYTFTDLVRGSYLVSSVPTENAHLNVTIPVDKNTQTVRVHEWNVNNVDFEAVSGRTIEGSVVTESGNPISGAEVTIAGYESVMTMSNNNGEFTLMGAPILSANAPSSMVLRVIATHSEYGSGISDPLPNEFSGPQLTEITIVVKGNASLQGQVVAKDGRGIDTAHVVLRDLFTNEVMETDSDGSGSFYFNEVPTTDQSFAQFRGTHQLVVTKEGYTRYQREVILSPGQPQNITVTLEGGNSIQGQISNNEGNPLGGVVVRALNPQEGEVTAVSDPYGRYSLNSLANASYDLLFRLESNPPLTGALYQIPAGEANADIVLTPNEWIFMGTVFDNALEVEEKNPLNSYTITIQGRPDSARGRSFIQTRHINSPDGTYQLTLTEPGDYTITFSAEGYHPWVENQVARAGATHSQFMNAYLRPLQNTGGLTGTFIPPEGMSLAGIRVLGHRDYAIQGNEFTLEDIPAGKHNLEFLIREGNAVAPTHIGVLPGVQVLENQIRPIGRIRAEQVTRNSVR